MITVLQRVSSASVAVDGCIIGQIKHGLLILCGFEPSDDDRTLKTMLDKCLNYRIFSDAQGKMNLSLKNIQGGLLLVPQFTLMANTKRGLRPSFSQGASPPHGKALFSKLVELAKSEFSHVEQGQFGADMKIKLCNDGPVTFIMSF